MTRRNLVLAVEITVKQIKLQKIKLKKEVVNLGLSEAAKQERIKMQNKFWLKKARDYEVDLSLPEEEVIKIARGKYYEEYYEKRAKQNGSA